MRKSMDRTQSDGHKKGRISAIFLLPDFCCRTSRPPNGHCVQNMYTTKSSWEREPDPSRRNLPVETFSKRISPTEVAQATKLLFFGKNVHWAFLIMGASTHLGEYGILSGIQFVIGEAHLALVVTLQSHRDHKDACLE